MVTVSLLIIRRALKDPSVFKNPKIKNPDGLHKWNYFTCDTIYVEKELFDRIDNEDPAALAEIEDLLRDRGHHGWRRLEVSKGYRKFRGIGPELSP